MTATKSLHPARFSDEIIRVFSDVLLAEYPDWFGRPYLWDPWAGTGERLHGMARALEFGYGGTEIEASFIKAPGIYQGDSTDPEMYPDHWGIPHPFVIITSPVYPNGVADHHKINDSSKRYSYRAAIKTIEGADRELHPANMGAYGYRSSSRDRLTAQKRVVYWDLARRSVQHWGKAELVLLNVSDFKAKRKGVVEVEPLVQDWSDLLREFGWVNQTHIPVGTRRMRNGSNNDVRVDHEYVIVGRKS